MPKPVAQVGEGHEDASGNGVYCFIRDLIVEGKDARFVDKRGRYVINWSRALKCYHDYKSKRNPQYKSKNINRRKASNGLRAALLNFYKREGAKEYKDCKKVNENDEVVERQFQMPPRVFESLFGSNVHLSDDSSEHETSSITSEADEKPLTTPNSSDTGFDEAMDISDDCALGGLPAGDPVCSNVKTEEEQVDPSDITGPCQMFGISGEDLDSVIGEICSNSDTDDIDPRGVVHDICPSSGSVKGGMQFVITLTEELSEDEKSGIAHFDGIGDVYLERLNCYTLAGTIPASQQPGTVPVTVNTQDGHLLGITCFKYVDDILELLKQVVKDPALQSLYLTMWCQEYGFFGKDGNLDSFTLQGQGSSVQGTHGQALKGLQLLVYTAAQTNAQQFIQMIFSTSAGRVVFNAYKDRPQLPEDVARANGHDDLAQYLQDVNVRLSKENSNDVQPTSIDWLELIEAVNKIQKQSSVIEDETDLEVGQSKDDDDHESDYFADVETSSCGSFELEIEWSDSEDREGPCSKEGGSDKEPDVKSASSMNVMPCKACTCAEVETHLDNDLDLKGDKNSEEGEVKEVCDIRCFGQQIEVATQKRENTSEREQEARACLDQEKCMQLKSPFTKDERPKKEPDERLTPSMEGTSSEAPTVLGTNLDNELEQKADGKNDRNLGTAEVGKSSMISQLSKKVAEKRQSGREKEASTVPSQEKTTKPKRTMKWLKGDAVTTSSQQGACVNKTQEVPSFRERSYQGVTGGGTQDSENINDRKDDAKTGPSQAKRHKQHTQWRPFRRALLKSVFLLTVSVITVLCLAAGIKLREGQLLHWAVRNGHIRISQALLKVVSDVDAPNFLGETPLHLAAKNGYKDLAELLMKLGSNVNSKDYKQRTPLHLAAWSGWQEIANALILHGSDVNAQDDSQQTALDLAALNGHRNVLHVLIQRGSDVNAKQSEFSECSECSACSEVPVTEEVTYEQNHLSNDTLLLLTMLYCLVAITIIFVKGAHKGCRVPSNSSSGHFSKGERPKKEPDRRLTQKKTMERISCEAPPVFGTNLDNEIDQKADGKHDGKLGTTEVGKSSLISQLSKKVAASGKEEEEESTVPSQEKTANPKRHKPRTQWRPFRITLLKSFLIAVTTVLCLAAGIKLRERLPLNCAFPIERIRIISDVDAPSFHDETPLHVTAKNEYQDLAELFMELGSNVNSKDYQQQTPLHLVACSRCQEIANALRRRHGNDAKARDDSQQTALHSAALSGHRKVLQVLIQNGNDANVLNITDNLGYTPLHLAAMKGHLQMAQFLIQRGGDVKARFGEFQLSAGDGDPIFGHKQIVKLLIHHGSAENKFRGHQELRDFLLRHGSGGQAIDDQLPNYDINVINNGRQSPLHLAAENDYKHICDVLTHNWSDVNDKDNFGKAPLHLVTINRRGSLADILGKHFQLLLRQTRYKCDLRYAPVVWTGTFLEYRKSGRSLEELLGADNHSNDTNFPQTSCKPLHQETQSCLASVNLSIGLGDDVSGPLDHKLMLNKQLITQCLNISLSGGDRITGDFYPVPVIKYQGWRSRFTSLIDHPACLLHSAKFATNGRPKDRDVNEAKYSHRVLIRGGLSLEDYAYALVNIVMVLLLLTLLAFKMLLG